MASAPPTLPMSTPQDTTTTAAAGPITTPAFRAFLSRLTDTARLAFSHRRPWSELFDRSAFSRPDTLSEATYRIRKNSNYFRINYLTLIVSVLAVSLLTNPFSLILLLFLLASWIFLYFFRPADTPLLLFGRTFTPRETLFGLILATIVVIFLTSVGSILISALMIGMAVVCTHGAFRVPDDLFLDEQESTATGLLAFLGAPASSPAPPPPPPAPRV